MKNVLGVTLALSLLLNAVLLLRKPADPPPPVVRTRVVEKEVPVVTTVPAAPLGLPPTTIGTSTPAAPAAAPATPPSVSLVASSSFVAPGGEITVSCTLYSGTPNGRQWVGLFAVNAAVTTYLGYHMVGSLPATFSFKAPRQPGDYEVRYVLEDERTAIATSNPVRVFGDPPAKPMVDLQSGTAYVKAGAEIPANWSLLSGARSTRDWIGLYAAGAKNEDYISWKYVADADRGQVTLQAPGEPGTYEMRYLLDNGYEAVATSVRIVVLP